MTDWRTIERISPDGLRREVWTFAQENGYPDPIPRLFLNDYRREILRPQEISLPVFGKWRPVCECGEDGWWNRIGSRTPQPPIPVDVRDEVRRRFCEAVTVPDPTETR